MRESAEAALSWVRANADALGLPAAPLEAAEIHLHVPAGAVPKDGPSAGIALATALVSALSGRRARGSVAMTGEISLRGRVLPVGGIKGKVLAAARAGIQTVVLPRRNERTRRRGHGDREKLEIRLAERSRVLAIHASIRVKLGSRRANARRPPFARLNLVRGPLRGRLCGGPPSLASPRAAASRPCFAFLAKCLPSGCKVRRSPVTTIT